MSKGGSTGAIVWLRQDLRLRDNPALQIGSTYPAPIVDLGESRRAALAAYQAI